MSVDEKYMKKALELAMNGCGYVNPNPLVGAVIVHESKIIAEGYHTAYGKPHAEVEAINKALKSGFDKFREADIYINLEPCSHYGKTPPCAPLLAEKKFKRAIIGMIDPNTQVKGNGIQILEAAGIEVVTGVLEEEAKWINRIFIKNVEENNPYIIVKTGMTIDGSIATKRGESKWITTDVSRERTHTLRALVDAVLVGKMTVSADNPQLNVRSISAKLPRRVILDTHLSLPLDLNVFKDNDRHHTIVCCSPDAMSKRKAENLKMASVNLLPVELNDIGKIDIKAAVKKLYEECDIKSILVEGGASIFSTFIMSGLTDEIQAFIAPRIIGNGLRVFGDISINYLRDTANFNLLKVDKSGNDIHAILTKQVKNEEDEEEK